MRQVLRRALPTAVAGVLLTGCAAEVVAGQASPGPGEPVDVAPDAFPITGVSDSRDRPVRAQRPHRSERLLGRRLPGVLRRGLHAAGERLLLGRLQRHRRGRLPRDRHRLRRLADRSGRGRRQRLLRPACDLIAYDRALLEELSTDYGRFLVPGRHGARVRARHAGPVRLRRERPQHPGRDPGRLPGRRLDRAGSPTARPSTSRCAPRSSTTSSAASCCSATTSAATPTTARRTAPTSTASRRSTRASTAAWARAATTSATDRLYTAAAFADDSDVDERRQRAFEDITDWVGTTLPEFWTEVFPTAFGSDFTPPAIEGFDGTAPTAPGVEDRDLGYCADDTTVYLDETDLATPAYDEIGDFALTTAMSLPYSLAVRDQAGLSIDDGAATRSAVCLTGWYEAQWYNGAFADIHRRRHQPRRHRRGRPVPARVRRPARGLPEHVGVRLRAGRGVPHRLPAGRRRLRPRPLRLRTGRA